LKALPEITNIEVKSSREIKKVNIIKEKKEELPKHTSTVTVLSKKI